MITCYLSHPLNDPTPEGIEANRRNAAAWGAWFVRTFHVAVSADYLWLSTQWDESPENRALGLEADKAHVERCHAMVLCGGRLSAGMRVERGHAWARNKPVLNLIPWGYEAPTGPRWARFGDTDIELEGYVRKWVELVFPGSGWSAEVVG